MKADYQVISCSCFSQSTLRKGCPKFRMKLVENLYLWLVTRTIALDSFKRKVDFYLIVSVFFCVLRSPGKLPQVRICT